MDALYQLNNLLVQGFLSRDEYEFRRKQQQVKQMQLEFDQSYSENHLKPSFGSLTSVDGVLSTPNKPKTPLLLKLNGENQHFFTGDRQTETHQTLSPSQLLLLKSQQSQQVPLKKSEEKKN